MPRSLSASATDCPTPLILYACPTGPLAQQLGAYFERSQERYGPNKAHGYMPHCTLTGFFHDQLSAVPGYLHAVEQALQQRSPPLAIRVSALTFQADWHGLALDAPALKAIAAQFAAIAPAQTRQDDLRLKDWLHLSLAYGFDPAHAAGLRSLAESLVDPNAPAGWELRFYQRQPEWVCHQRWPLFAHP